MCNREGFKSKDIKEINDPLRKRRKQTDTRCGCDAHIFVKLCGENTYKIDSWIEHHVHGLVSPDKRHLIRSNRRVSERAKNTLYTCHKASIGTSQAYRLLQVSEGGIPNAGCTKRDFQNYYRGLRYKIRDADAQMFVAQLARKQEVNSAFFYDFEVNDEGNLVRVFWADATSRKNYSHFGDVISFDSTYTTNQYNMIFTPFTGVNHHLQSVLFGAGFLSNEKDESYIWLFQTFLKAMGGVAPRLIITDEAASIKNDFGLEDNEWLAKRFTIRDTWIPAYFMDISLAGLLQTTSRLAFVEFWLRFDTALECQREEELMADNRSMHTTPQLFTPWTMEKQGSEGIAQGVGLKMVTLRGRSDKVLRIENQNELPNYYIMKRWKKRCKRENVYDEQGNLLEEKPTDSLDAATRKKISTVRDKMEELIQKAKHSNEGMDFLTSSVLSIEAPLDQMVPAATQNTRQEEYEAFIGCNIPTEVHIHPPTDVRTVGRCKRIKSGKEIKEGDRKRKDKEAKLKVARLCKTCKQMVFHDSRNCPSKTIQGKRSLIAEDVQPNGAS
nr:protein FAR1-RELATED SEQUENCE 5-like [Aegilops tauschii subsp. strangulata]